MNYNQALTLERAQQRIGMSDGELMRLAGEAAHDGALVSLADLTQYQTAELIGTLDRIERDQVTRKFQRELVGV